MRCLSERDWALVAASREDSSLSQEPRLVELRAHLEDCSRCSARSAEIADLIEMTSHLHVAVEPDPFFGTRFRQRLEKTVLESRVLWRRATYGLAAAAAIVLTILGTLVTRDRQRDEFLILEQLALGSGGPAVQDGIDLSSELDFDVVLALSEPEESQP